MSSHIRSHINESYVNLRKGMAIIAFMLPILLLLGAWISDKFVAQGSISAYYHTPMRNVFVGVLISIGTFLYLYKGFSEKENYALNFAGIFAILVAILPTSVPPEIANSGVMFLPKEPFVSPYLHGVAAVLFFICIAYVCLYSSEDTIEHIPDEKRKNWYRRIYKMYGSLMILMPVLAAVLSFMAIKYYAIFIVELIAIWIFAAFWLTKSRELDDQAERIESDIMALADGGLSK